MYWLNPLAYTLYALIVTQLGDLTNTFVEYNGESITVPQLLEDRFGYKYSFRWPATVILIVFLLVFRVASILAIKILNFQVGAGLGGEGAPWGSMIKLRLVLPRTVLSWRRDSLPAPCRGGEERNPERLCAGLEPRILLLSRQHAPSTLHPRSFPSACPQ